MNSLMCFPYKYIQVSGVGDFTNSKEATLLTRGRTFVNVGLRENADVGHSPIQGAAGGVGICAQTM